jgi:hypothetical protein
MSSPPRDRLDYWFMQAKLWLADVVYSPLSDRDLTD